MQAVKRVEIVTDSLEMAEVLTVLEGIGIVAYTLVKDVVGRGERGLQAGDDLADVFRNSLLLTTCQADKLPSLIEAIRPILKRRGGICLVSDAQWVLH